jgi:glycosyltransferase involved in cell wall biosynthesis
VLNYYPNEQAVNFIINEIVPRLNKCGQPYQLLIGGKGLAEPIQQQIAAQKDTMQYVGFIDDLDTFLQACDMMLNPVQLGGGIKTKAVEALGYNKKVVSTASGAAGISAAACGTKLRVVADNDWDSFTQAIIDQMNNQTQIPDTFYATYYWGNIAEKILGIMNR